ncbi:hypothetical protein PVAP13_7KG013900 [Panicum virgatum]|uniref:Cupin type-1 domain-containing protein n=1 Tax=Panicum virgatum TaxID=38727 RepID=A0A8T0QEI7_PANVG|nr:hypothetical protein PVAP13_7KG013900 [Panicum virgatum]
MGAMKRSPLVLVLLLFLCSSLALASYSYGEDGSGSGSGRPYHYGEESFRHWTRSRQGRFRVLERFTHELLEDAVMFVKEGEGVVALLYRGRRESFCVREGDVLVIPAGAVVYSANTHASRWFRVVMLLNPVSTTGRFEEFFPIGGESPESFFSVFSDDVLQAAFNTRREEWEQVFEKQSKGEITTASEEQIRELSRSCSRGSRGHGGGESMWDIKPSSLTGKRPSHSNSHGRHYEITGDDCPQLRALDIEVGLANITRGSMMAPSYSTHANKLVVVVEGSGHFEMACPHLSGGQSSSSQRRGRGHGGRECGGEEEEGEGREEQEGEHKSRGYKQVRSRIKVGSVMVIPPGHPTTLVAGDDKNLAVLCFGINARHDEKVFLAGSNSVLRQMDELAKALAFGAEREKVDRVIGAQTDAVFLRGPSSRRISSE